MQKNITLNFKEMRSKLSVLIKIFKENIEKLLLIGLIIIGIRIGSMIFSGNNDISEYAVKALNYILHADLKHIFMIFAAINIITVLLVFTSGFSACGLPATIISPCIYGILCGIASCCAYNIYKINGVFFSLILIVPFAVLISVLIILISNESIKLSKQIIKSIGFGDVSGRGDVKVFLAKGITGCGIALITSFVQSLLISQIGEKILNI